MHSEYAQKIDPFSIGRAVSSSKDLAQGMAPSPVQGISTRTTPSAGGGLEVDPDLFLGTDDEGIPPLTGPRNQGHLAYLQVLFTRPVPTVLPL